VGTLAIVQEIPRPSAEPLARSAEASLVRRLSRGDADALDAIYRDHGAACYRIARRVTANQTLAEDCVQEAFLGLWRRPERFDPGSGSLRSWLLAMTHHKAVDAVRREAAQQRRQAAESAVRALDPPGRGDPEESAWRTVRADGVRSALAELPGPQREAIALAYYGGYTQTEIARLTGAPLGTVKTRMLAGMRRLRAALGTTVSANPDGAR
jgi:RNA polymerase sigma factor (sigma-70 family)